jgi:hypothetical protein
MKAKPSTKGWERWRRADRNFAVATIALMVFFLVAGFSAWMFDIPGTAAASHLSPARPEACPQRTQPIPHPVPGRIQTPIAKLSALNGRQARAPKPKIRNKF